MPLHIDEIAIQLAVGEPEPRRDSGSSSTRRPTDDDDSDRSAASADSGCCDHQAIVAEAVAQVLKILRDREGR